MLGFKGQGALEYLMLIGGAIILAVIIITISGGFVKEADVGSQSPYGSKCASLIDEKKCTSCGWANFNNDGDLDCTWDNATETCVPDPTVDTLCQT